MSTTPFGNDGNYSHELITNHSNAFLSNDLGNLSQRCLKMVFSKCDGKMLIKVTLITLIYLYWIMHIACIKVSEFMNDYQIHAYLNSIFDIITSTNKYFSDQKPWELDKKNSNRMNTVLWVTCEILRVAILLQPVIIEGSNKLLDFLNVDLRDPFLFKF